MKVMCINDNGWYCIITGKRAKGPEYGEIVTVTREYTSPVDNDKYYDLQEYPPKHNDDGFGVSLFIPISDIDEKEILEQRKLQEV